MLFFFFKQKTAYELRISDWSSDVCSSDLSIRLRCVAGLDGGTSHATCSLAACRRCCRCARAAPTLPDQRRGRRIPTPFAAHAGETARVRQRAEVPPVRPERHVSGCRPLFLGRPAQLRTTARTGL